MEFKGKTCVVSGAAGGIAFALCEQYAKDGANVVMLDVNEEGLKRGSEKLKAMGAASVLLLKVDLTSVEQIKKAMKKVEETFGAVNVIANCAGVSLYNDVLEYTEENWNLSLDLNLKGVFFLSQAGAQNMVKHGVKNGKIVSISSQAGVVGEPGGHAYGASKAGVRMMTQTMALDLAKYGICCTAIAPGCTNTEMIRAYFKRACVLEGMSPEEFAKMRTDEIPLGRLAEPEEIANLMYFLSSEKANYITGCTIDITGGVVNV